MDAFHSIALLYPEIKELLRDRNYTLLKQVMRDSNPIEFADCWKRFDEDERLQIFRLLPARSALKLFEILDIGDQQYLLSRLGEESITPLLENVSSPELVKVFHKMSPRQVNKMKSLIKRQEAVSHINLMMKFPERTVGSLMHPEFVKLEPRMTARQVLQLMQAIVKPGQKEHLYGLFVTDGEGKVLGSITLQDLLAAPEDETLAVIMSSVEGVKLTPDGGQDAAARLFSKYNLTTAPVVDTEGRLLGILTAKDIISVVRQEATEDIAKMVGTRAVEIDERSVFRIVGFRMPWLVVTLVAGVFISVIIRAFEPVLSRIIALASFSPILAGMGGNVGSQSATIVVRSLALGQINGHRKGRTIFREMRVGFLLGLIYGVLIGIIAYVIYGDRYHLVFSVVVGVSMCVSMTTAATMGAIGPIVLDRMGADPATATAPMITTLTDILTILTYFSLATLLLMAL